MDFDAGDLDELLRTLPDFFLTSLGKPDFVTPTTVDEFSTTADKAATIQASPPAALVVSLAQLPQLHGLIPRGDGDAVTSAIGAEQWERIARMKDAADKWTLAEDKILLEGVTTVGPKWRRIAVMLPNRSEDALRNRFKRLEKLEKARRHNDTTGVAVVATWATCLPPAPTALPGRAHPPLPATATAPPVAPPPLPSDLAQMFDEPTIGLGAAPAAPQAPSMARTASDTGEPPALPDGCSAEDAPVSEPDYALDSLYENDMLESVPVAPGEQSLYEQEVAAALKRKQMNNDLQPLNFRSEYKLNGEKDPYYSAAIAVASWRRYR